MLRRTLIASCLLLTGCLQSVVDEVMQKKQPLSACAPSAQADGSRTLLGLVAGTQLRLLKANGTWKVAHELGASTGTEAKNVIVNTVVNAGGFAAVHAYLAGATFEAGRAEVALIDTRSGALVWSKVYEVRSHPLISLDSNGTLVVEHYMTSGEIIWANGASQVIAAAGPLGPPSAGGKVPVMSRAQPSAAYGWHDLSTGKTAPLARAVHPDDARSHLRPEWKDGHLIYRSIDANGRVLLIAETADGAVKSVDLGLKAPAITEVGSGGWVLLGYPETTMIKANPLLGIVKELPRTAPAGFEPQASFRGKLPRLGEGGAVWAPFDRESGSQAFETIDDGVSWRALGDEVQPKAPVYGRHLSIATRRRTTLLAAQDSRGYWYDWVSAQVVRPSEGISRPVPVALTRFGSSELPPQLSDDGACVSFWDSPGGPSGPRTGTLKSLDVRTGELANLFEVTGEISANPFWVAAP